MVGETREIPIKDLEIDKENIRDSPSADQDLIKSVENKGVLEPLLVRELDNGNYGIVCGSRRFQAAMNAGLDTVPAVVKDLDDLDAQALSVVENRHREDIPGWRMAEIVEDRFKRINGNMERPEKVKKIAEDFNIAAWTVRKYLNIAELPEEIRARLKKPRERSEQEKASLEAVAHGRVAEDSEQIPVRVATKFAAREDIVKKARENPEWGQTALDAVMDEYNKASGKKAKMKAVSETLETLEVYPDLDPEEARRKSMEVSPGWSVSINFDPRYREALGQYSEDAGYGSRKSAFKAIVEEYLKEKGYL